MIAQLKTLPANAQPEHDDKSITELLSAYAIATMKLEAMADEVPHTEQDIDSFDQRQSDLLKQKMTLVDKAATQPILTKADCTAALKFWKLEKIGFSDESALDPVDKLLLSACVYLRNNARNSDSETQ